MRFSLESRIVHVGMIYYDIRIISFTRYGAKCYIILCYIIFDTVLKIPKPENSELARSD